MTEEQAKALVENLGKLQEEGSAAGFPCPRCGHDRMDPDMVRNALSRRAKVYICPDCGTDEALRDMVGEPPIPFVKWGMALGFAGGEADE